MQFGHSSYISCLNLDTKWSKHNQNGVVLGNCTAFSVRNHLRMIFFRQRNLSLPFIFPSTFVTMDSPERYWSNSQPIYVTHVCCSILISPRLMSSWSRFFNLFCEPKTIDFVYPHQNGCLIYFQRTSHTKNWNFYLTLFLFILNQDS